MEADRRGGPVGLVAVDTVDVDEPLFTVDLGDFALSPLVLAADDQDFIVFAKR